MNWFAAVAEGSETFSSTIRTYRSALSLLHHEGPQRHLPNPLDSEALTRLIKGITREKSASEKIARNARSIATIEITPEELLALEPIARGDSPESIAKWAAITLGTFGLLRIGELLGQRDGTRILQTTDIRFYLDSHSRDEAGLLPHADEIPRHALPDHFTVTFGSTKADQLGKNPPLGIAARPAVAAMWRWVHTRRDNGIDCPELWKFSCRHPTLALSSLVSYLQDWYESLRKGRPHITGKAFRRGGASGLVSTGVPREDAAAAGRWRSQAMVETYANAQSKQQRALLINRQMAP
jgi:hypothetical protein